MRTYNLVASFVLSGLLLGLPVRGSAQAMSEGPPGHIDVLGEQSFLPVELRQLAHAQLWYLRYDSLRARGIKIPPAGLADPKFAEWYLSQNAYQTPGRDDRPEMFTEKTKIAYADFYGGEGNHGVQGSGRATLNGLDQHKGNLTPMVPEANRDPNMNGAQQIIDGMEEAVWSEILHHEFKYGANETFDVIFTGNYATHHSSGQIFPRGLQGRRFAVRMAHFMLRPGPIDQKDLARVKSIMPQLLKALPYPEGKRPADDREALRTGLLEFTHREAYTQAEYYAKRLYFGSDSPSNVTIDGERKDLTMHSAFLGYTRVYRPISDGLIPFGTIDEALLTFKELQDSLSKTLPPELLPALPTQEEFIEFFKKTYARQVTIEMARLSGIPNEMLDVKRPSSKFTQLGEVLTRISRAGNDKNVKLDMDGIKYTDRYKLNKMLIDLGSRSYGSLADVSAAVQKWIPDDAGLRRELSEKYFAFRSEVEKLAPRAGLSVEAVNTYVKEASAVRNLDRTELVLSNQRISKFWQVADKAIETHNGSVVESFLQGLVDHNTFSFKDAGRLEVVLKQKRKPAEGLVLREVFDAKKNTYSTIVRVNVANGEGYLNGKRFSAQELERSGLKTEGKVVSAKRSGANVEFVFEGVRSLDLSKVEAIPSVTAKGTVTELRRTERATPAEEALTAKNATSGAPRRRAAITCEGVFAR